MYDTTERARGAGREQVKLAARGQGQGPETHLGSHTILSHRMGGHHCSTLCVGIM